GLGYLNPRPWYAAELARARKALDDSPDRVTIVYVTTASAMMSKYGRAGMDEILDGARQLCLQILYERHGAVKISMMADHGHNLMASKFISLEAPLKAAGFHPAAHLHRPNDTLLEVNAVIPLACVRKPQPEKVAT